jgi:hypothetical protein
VLKNKEQINLHFIGCWVSKNPTLKQDNSYKARKKKYTKNYTNKKNKTDTLKHKEHWKKNWLKQLVIS